MVGGNINCIAVYEGQCSNACVYLMWFSYLFISACRRFQFCFHVSLLCCVRSYLTLYFYLPTNLSNALNSTVGCMLCHCYLNGVHVTYLDFDGSCISCHSLILPPYLTQKNNSIMRAGRCHLSVQPFPAAFRVPNCTWLLSSPFSFLYIRNLALTCLSTSYSFNYGPITSALRIAHRHFSSALLV